MIMNVRETNKIFVSRMAVVAVSPEKLGANQPTKVSANRMHKMVSTTEISTNMDKMVLIYELAERLSS